MNKVIQKYLAGRRPEKYWSMAVVCAAFVVCANEICFAEKPDVSIDFSGYTSFQAGEIVKGRYGGNGVPDTLDHRWQEKLLGGFNLSALVNKRLKIDFNPEAAISQAVYDYSPQTNFVNDLESMHAYYYFYLNQMQATYSFGNLENPFLKVSTGYFPFTYNRDIKSLGEYLFRATAYPGYIVNDFASVYKRLLGLHVQSEPVQNLKLDLLFTSEMQAPVGDWTPSLLASYAMGGQKNHPLAEVGAGVSFTRLFSVDSRLTSPHYINNEVVTNADTFTTPNGDSIVGDTTYFSFSAIKVMARFSLDIKQFFGAPGIFGDEDLKLYGEACILGIKDYPVYYDSILRRIPIMVGFNIPAFKLLDVLSVEVEWYDNKFANDYTNTYYGLHVTPTPVISNYEPKPFPLYWSVFARRSITHGIQLLAEVTRNHYYTQTKYPNYQDRCEATPSHGDWMFIGRIQYSF